MATRRNFLKATSAGALGIATSTGWAAGPAVLRAGAAEIEVNPDKGTFLVGPMCRSEGVHDDLYARVLIIEDGETRIAVATLDYLGFDFAYTRGLISVIAEAAGIPISSVMLNCSHTHSAPLTAPWGPWLKEKDLSFHRFLPGRLKRITGQAVGSLVPVRCFSAREPAQIGFNRRLIHEGRVVMATNPGGASIPWVDVLGFEGRDGKLVASLFSHAAHPVIVHESSPLVSGDYPGYAVRQVRKRSGHGIHLFAQGCSGNINAFPLKGGLDAAKAAGAELGNAVHRALVAESRSEVAGPIKTASHELDLPLGPPPPAELLREVIRNEKNPEKRERREVLLEIAESGEKQRMAMPLRAFSIGDVCLMGMAHEPFAEYHHFLEGVSPFSRTLAFGYTNGLECYVGTKADYKMGENGGYETSPYGAAIMFESRLPLALDAEEQIRTGLRGLLGQISKG